MSVIGVIRHIFFLNVYVGAVFEKRGCSTEAQAFRARAASQGHNGESEDLQSH